MRNALLVPLLVAAALPAAVAAQAKPDSAAFLIRLGHDTTAVERYVRTASSITAEAVQRSPNTQVHRLELRLAPDGRITGGEYEVRLPGAAQPAASRTFHYPAKPGDSLVVQITQGGNTRRVALAGSDAVPVIGPFYLPYELAIQRFVRGTAASARIPLLTGTSLGGTQLQRVGRDTVALTNQFDEPMRAHVDAQGRIVHLHTPAYVTVERTRWLDLDRMATEFAARDAAGKGLGTLSPRSAARIRVGEANVWLDYSRPSLRGRPSWGGLVRFGEVWRLGANDATHLSTDRPLQLGSLALDPGTYTLFLLPEAADRWTLIVNRRTGMSGLDYNGGADVGRVALTVEVLPRAAEQLTIAVQSGNAPRLEIAWGDRRGYVPLQVR